jgi:hypothetical protein
LGGERPCANDKRTINCTPIPEANGIEILIWIELSSKKKRKPVKEEGRLALESER